MADLSPEALSFLKKHLGYDDRNRVAKALMRKRMEKFLRRKQKTEAEISVLPPDHPDLRDLRNAVKAAEKTAQTDLKAAYDELDTVKISARSKADTVKNGVSAQTLLADLVPLVQKCQTLRTLAALGLSAVTTKATTIEGKLDGILKASEGTTRDEIIRRAGLALGQKTALTKELGDLDALLKGSKDKYNAGFGKGGDNARILDRARHNSGLLEEKGLLTGPLRDKLQFVGKTCDDFGLDKNPAVITQLWDNRVADCRKTVDDALSAAMALPDMGGPSGNTDDAGNPVADGAFPDFGDNADSIRAAIARFDAKNEALVEAARERMRADAKRDADLAKAPVASPAVVPSRVTPFDTAEALDVTELGYNPADPDVAAETFAADAAARVESELDAVLKRYEAGAGKVPDEVLEIASRTVSDWHKEVASAMGLVWDEATLDEGIRAKITAAAAAMQEKALALYPDKGKRKDSGELSDFTMAGVHYNDLKVLGEGGGGRVYLARSVSTDQAGREVVHSEVVIKEPLNVHEMGDPEEKEKAVREMATEISTQRSVTGGEEGECSENLLEHKGMVLSPEGVPLPVMDLADAGDAEEFNNIMKALPADLMPEAARQALVAAQMRDVLKGVKAMHDQGFSHFDLKNLNVFMMKDGTYKVADFGMAQKADTRDATLEGKFQGTLEYVAPEVGYMTGDIDMKADNFSLGAMLMRSVSPTSRREEVLRGRDMNTQAGNTAPQETKVTKTPSDKEGEAETEEKVVKTVEVSASSRLLAGLMADDPADRPSIETALESSYFLEIERDIDPAVITRLRKAASEYSATVGRATKGHDKIIVDSRAMIIKCERMLSGEAKEDVERAAEVAKVRKGHEKARWQKVVAELSATPVLAEQNSKRIAEINVLIADLDESIEKATMAVEKMREDPESRAFADTERMIRSDLERARKTLEDAEAAVREIRADDKWADVTRELKEATAALR